MNSYTLGISGNILVLILSILVGFALAYYSYLKPVPPLSSAKRWLMISLRTVALALLLFILFEPILTGISVKKIKPKIAVFIDNSISAALTDGAGSRAEKMNNIINSIDFENSKDLLVHKFSGNIQQIEDFHQDSLDFSGIETNISNIANYAIEKSDNENIIANIIISDGSFNSGDNPIYAIEKYDRPFYTIGIGDTNIPKDIIIRSMISNEIAYIDNEIPISINISADGFNQTTSTIELFEDGKKINEQIVNINSDNFQNSVLFSYTPKTEGIKKISAKIKDTEGEISTKNNSKTVFVRVLKSKKKIAIIAGAPNADLSFIKKELLKDKGIEVLEYVQKSGQTFYEIPTLDKLQQSELIVLSEFPNQYTPNSAINAVKEALKTGKPLLFISGFNTDYAKLRMLEDFLPFKTITSSKQEFLANADVESYSISSPLLRINGDDNDINIWNDLPPLFKTETFVQIKPESELVAGLKVNNTKIQEPLILSRNFQREKSVAVLGYGLYRWKLMQYAGDKAKGKTDSYDVYSIFVNNAVKWLSVDANKKLFTVRAVKPQFTGNEPVEIYAEVYDASYNPIENATVNVQIKSDKEQRDAILLHKGNGRYYATIEGLAKGDYIISGSAILSSKLIGRDSDRFSVGNLELEYTSLTMNKKLLEVIAERTNGKFYYEKTDNILENIRNSSEYKERNITVTKETAIWNLPWILGIAVILFAWEWFLRKRAGMI